MFPFTAMETNSSLGLSLLLRDVGVLVAENGEIREWYRHFPSRYLLIFTNFTTHNMIKT
jgi:hypothetical protein